MMAAIFAFSSIPSAEMPSFGFLDYLVKKGGHAFGYGLLGLTYMHGLKGESHVITVRHLLLAWILATLYSATDELHQAYVPGRNPAMTDVLIDSIGAAVALFLVSRYQKQK